MNRNKQVPEITILACPPNCKDGGHDFSIPESNKTGGWLNWRGNEILGTKVD